MILRRCPCGAMRIELDGLTACPGRPGHWCPGSDITRQQARVLQRLAAARGGWVSSAELIDWVWGEREDGGPDMAQRIVYILVHRLRHRLPERGWAIVTQPAGKGSMGYRLEQLEKVRDAA